MSASGEHAPGPPATSRCAPAEPDFLNAFRRRDQVTGERNMAAVDRDRMPARDDVGQWFARRLPSRHLHHVPESQKLYGNTDLAVSGQSRRQQPDAPPVLRSATCAWQGIGGQHIVHQVGQHADGAEQPGQGCGAVGAAADAEHEDPVAGFPRVDQKFICLGDRGPCRRSSGLAPPQPGQPAAVGCGHPRAGVIPSDLLVALVEQAQQRPSIRGIA